MIPLPAYACCSVSSAASPSTSQHLRLEIGRHSRMRTMSPILQRFCSSCAAYFFDRVMYFLYRGSCTRRSTRTTIVLSALSLTTVPCRTRLGIAAPSACRPALGPRLREDGLDPRDVAPHLAHPGGVLELTGGLLEAQVVLLLLQLQKLVRQLVSGLALQLRRLHRTSSP